MHINDLDFILGNGIPHLIDHATIKVGCNYPTRMAQFSLIEQKIHSLHQLTQVASTPLQSG